MIAVLKSFIYSCHLALFVSIVVVLSFNITTAVILVELAINKLYLFHDTKTYNLLFFINCNAEKLVNACAQTYQAVVQCYQLIILVEFMSEEVACISKLISYRFQSRNELCN